MVMDPPDLGQLEFRCAAKAAEHIDLNAVIDQRLGICDAALTNDSRKVQLL